jgi:hypothetical protein
MAGPDLGPTCIRTSILRCQVHYTILFVHCRRANQLEKSAAGSPAGMDGMTWLMACTTALQPCLVLGIPHSQSRPLQTSVIVGCVFPID